ncbi:hypothetical protein DV515_00020052 [Chloebia gouldiae]|uniref:EF-hand domain-containing protein n=1 Tax=Chloebia gouldiae TaxID=44316 RepID=A0A3L8Q261_CHLGU|nr:hypothetical protein DV515_00020051 [Chloebia gouldiae]RLV61777.1 hypothetical protein DV515_00020052 [Chloebia gouldiae]
MGSGADCGIVGISLMTAVQGFSIPSHSRIPCLGREFPLTPGTGIPVFLQNQKDPGVVDRMMKKLDMNSDGQLDFQEFLNLIGGIAVACHDSLILKTPNP